MDEIRKSIQSERNSIEKNITSQVIGVDMIDKEIEKGKSLPEGTKRTHGGQEVVKRGGQWIPTGKKQQTSSKKKDREPSEQEIDRFNDEYNAFESAISVVDSKFEDDPDELSKLSVERTDNGNLNVYEENKKLTTLNGKVMSDEAIEHYGLQRKNEEQQVSDQIDQAQKLAGKVSGEEGKELVRSFDQVGINVSRAKREGDDRKGIPSKERNKEVANQWLDNASKTAGKVSGEVGKDLVNYITDLKDKIDKI